MTSRVARQRVAIVTGSRAEFGLLEPVMRAIAAHDALELLVVAAGAHFLKPAETWREVAGAFELAARVPMQRDGETGRIADASALGRGVQGFADAFARLQPVWVVVLGDRIEAFAGASAASVGGIAVVHLHGGDRAEGVADEAMRHAITKLAHLHLPATQGSAERILRMGERPEHVVIVGSPAIDGLDAMPLLSDERHHALGSPDTLFLMHPVGRDDAEEERAATAALGACADLGRRVLALAPNFDPGREGIARAVERAGVRTLDHLPRREWVGLMKRVALLRGALVGDSSAGLIEASAIAPPLPSVDIGPRQRGRERPETVITARDETREAILEALRAALALNPRSSGNLYGDGRAGPRTAAALASLDPRSPALLRKRCAH